MPTRPPRRCPNLGCPHTTPCPDHGRRTDWPTQGNPLYKGKEWQRLRYAVMQRDANTCQRCGAPATHVDHIIPLHLGGQHTVANCQALCATCHRTKTAHEGRNRRNAL